MCLLLALFGADLAEGKQNVNINVENVGIVKRMLVLSTIQLVVLSLLC